MVSKGADRRIEKYVKNYFPVGDAVLDASAGGTKPGVPVGEAVLEGSAGGTMESGARSAVAVPVVPFCADTDVTRYEIENNENMINANDKRVILFINFSSSNYELSEVSNFG